MRKFIKFDKIIESFSKRRRFKIVIDKNLNGLGDYVTNLGYLDVTEITDSREDEIINQQLNSIGRKLSTKPLILITKDYDDFLEFSNRQYFIIGIKTDYPFIKISNKLNEFLSNGKSKISKGGIEMFTKDV